jgi:hypothetical protein
MQPRSIDMPNIDLVDPKSSPSRGKRAVQILLALTHILIAILLLVIVILVLVSRYATPFILYLLPLITLTIALEICNLCHRRLPSRISVKLGALTRLRARAFMYQVAAGYGFLYSPWGPRCYGWYGGYYCSGNDGILIAVKVLAWIVWSLGVALFMLAIVSSECEFADWVEEPEEGEEQSNIQLVDSDSEDGDLVGRGGISQV